MDHEAEMERIRLYANAAQQRVRRLEALLDEQTRAISLDPGFGLIGPRRNRGARQSMEPPFGHAAGALEAGEDGMQSFTLNDLKLFAGGLTLAAFAAFVGGYWLGRG